ncbi:MAG: peptidyl-prolyl cis-trans isomerase [Puniceicoccales bacterium]|jgi:peptidyl-prolyl cis-trans isomerase SurA|nr:peptidyl-prolyl cis-trans isomerase [Puniceicoccales bacterium]
MENSLSVFIVSAMSFFDRLWNCVIIAVCVVFLSVSGARCEDVVDFVSDEISDNMETSRENNLIPVYANDIAAIVNDEIITVAQVMRGVAYFLPQIRAESWSLADFNRKIHEAKNTVLNAMIEKILIVSDFKAKGGRIPDGLCKKEYEAHVRNRFNGDRVAFAKFLRESGKSVREFKKDIEESVVVSFVVSDILKSKMEISPAKIREYYDEHIQDFIVDRQVFVSEISIAKKNYGENELQSKIAAVVAAIKNGKDLQHITSTFSDFRKNQIGWVVVDQLIPEFSDVVRGLQSGEFSEPVVTDDRVYIFFVSDERPAKKFAIGEVNSDIERILAAKYKTEVRDNYVKKLKERAYVKIFL